jgi:hypothetical protein
MTSAAALVAALVLAGCSDPCGNTVASRATSPDGRHEVVVFERTCGATTGTSVQVSLVDPSEEPRGAGNVFRGEGEPSRPDAKAAPAVEARWASSSELVVRYGSALRIFAREPDVRGVRIVYQPAG